MKEIILFLKLVKCVLRKKIVFFSLSKNKYFLYLTCVHRLFIIIYIKNYRGSEKITPYFRLKSLTENLFDLFFGFLIVKEMDVKTEDTYSIFCTTGFIGL